MAPKHQLLVLLSGTFIILLIIASSILVWWWYHRYDQIKDFESCSRAGYAILESFPEQCRTPDGRTFTRQLTDEEQKNLQPAADYYGRSTEAACADNSACTIKGCNDEICGGIHEGMTSICSVPSLPLPKEVGLSCQCVASKCQWTK